MTATVKSAPLPVSMPVASPALADSFPASAELGESFDRLAEAQAEVDRKKVEELARLRAIQDRD